MKNNPLRLAAGFVTVVVALYFATFSHLYAITVTTSADENDSPAGANISLREAIRDTASGGTVDFDASLSGGTIFLLNGDISISKNLTVDASSLANRLIVVQNSDQFTISGTNTVNISGLSFTGASNTANGGAFVITGGAIVTFNDCRLNGNTTTLRGGAISNSSSTLVMNDCELDCNEAQGGRGGAIYGADGGVVITLNNTKLSENTSNGLGGALHTQGGSTVVVNGCSFLDNEATFGGALSQTNGNLTIDASCLARNKASTAGGGMFLWVSSNVTVTNTTIANNDGAGGGGAIALDDSASLDLESSTVVRNVTEAQGGGIFVNTGCTLDLTNCVIADNSAGGNTDLHSNGGTITRNEVNLIGSNLGVETEFPNGSPNGNGDLVGTDASPIDPELSLLGYYGGSTMCLHPLAGSPVLQAGGSTSLTNDQRGYSRVVSSLLDLGAVEGGPAIVVNTAVDENDGSLGVGDNSLRECIGAVSTPGTRIVFAAGVNGATLTLSNGSISTQDLEIIIDASAMTNGITIDGNSSSGIFLTNKIFADTTLALESLELVNANAGAVTCSGGAKFTAANCTFSSNSKSAGPGGALSLTNGSSGVIESSVFDQNSSSSIGGGAIYANYSDLYVNQSTFTGNTAAVVGEGRGGAIYSLVAPFYVRDCLFSSNTATGSSGSYGGAVYYSNILSYIPQKTTMLSSTFIGNSASAGGGGAIAIKETFGTITCRHLTVVSNNADSGGGFYIERTGNSYDSLTIDHCIIADNVSPVFTDIQYVTGGGSAQMFTSGPNLIGDNSSADTLFSAGPLVGTFGAEVDPVMGTLGSYGGPTETVYLASGSPAIDAGAEGDDTPFYDQRGFGRIVGSAPDIGAYENGNIFGYTLWTQESIPSGDDDAFNGNAENDSHLNGTEYATGLSPAQVDSGSVLSAVLMPDGIGGYEMHLTFPYEPMATDLKYTIERNDSDLIGFVSRYSLNLNTGVEVTPVGADVTATVDPDAKTITVVDGDLSSDKYFWELKIEQVP